MFEKRIDQYPNFELKRQKMIDREMIRYIFSMMIIQKALLMSSIS